ncbi:hypothetical protein [Curvibacter gracilis]|uniref:hypothetical protein n=1 Tax=Curvibacter gracilis TaxID=230310 RepID=UPI0012F9C4F8|nr:hypothetical protein [Curvibacter gracilis]
MSNERYSQDLVVAVQDFTQSGWREAIARATREGYSAIWQALSGAACSASSKDEMNTERLTKNSG